MLRNSESQWGSVSKFLHWFIAVFILIMLCIGFSLDLLPKNEFRSVLMGMHKSMGLTILGLMVIRLLWSWLNPKPKLPSTTPFWQERIAELSHKFLYFSVIGIPLSGWMMSTAAGHPVNYWWLVKLSMPGIPKNKPLAHLASDVHLFFAWMIVGLLVLHISGAWFHHLKRKDNVLKRMMPNGGS